jgi:hypothetical protein
VSLTSQEELKKRKPKNKLEKAAFDLPTPKMRVSTGVPTPLFDENSGTPPLCAWFRTCVGSLKLGPCVHRCVLWQKHPGWLAGAVPWHFSRSSRFPSLNKLGGAGVRNESWMVKRNRLAFYNDIRSKCNNGKRRIRDATIKRAKLKYKRWLEVG